MNKILNIALVGCGGMAGIYRHLYTQIEGARLALLVDANAATASAAAEKLGVSKWSTDFQDCLDSEIDVVDISTPNHLHKEQAVAALRAGKHVLLQKPIAPNVQDAEEIVRAGRESGKISGMYMYKRDNPVFYEVKDIIKKGLLGQISSTYCRNAHTGGLRAEKGSWRNSLEKTGGGALIQLGVHDMNILQWLLDDKICKVSAFSKNIMCPNIGGDDITHAVYEYESGIIGTVEAAYCAEGSIAAVYGTEGYVILSNECNVVDIKLKENYQGALINYQSATKAQRLLFELKNCVCSNPCEQHIAFIKSVMQKVPASVSLETGLYDLKIVEAIYKSAREKQAVTII